MLEIPESRIISLQANETLTGKRVLRVEPPSSPHKFAWYNGDPTAYDELLAGKMVESVSGHGAHVHICLEDDTHLIIGDGAILRYYPTEAECPAKFQLAVLFDDYSCIAVTIAMYGGIWACRGEFQNPYFQGSLHSISPLDDAFDASLFEHIFQSTKKDMSVKALLATEQRIPGLGNGVLQDILFNASIHPKRKKSTLTDHEKELLFYCLKTTLKEMTEQGGRDTEKDFHGVTGRYRTILSKNTYHLPCPRCESRIIKEAYLGGSIYYCPYCQKL